MCSGRRSFLIATKLQHARAASRPRYLAERFSDEKLFPTAGILGAFTGVVLVDRGFNDIHDVLDHLFPGIMTLGCAAMQPHAAIEILRQHPSIVDLGPCTSENYQEWYTDAIDKFGPTMEIDGPLEVSDIEISRAFERLHIQEHA